MLVEGRICIPLRTIPTNRLFIVTARETCATYYSYNEPFKDGERYAGGGGVRLKST